MKRFRWFLAGAMLAAVAFIAAPNAADAAPSRASVPAAGSQGSHVTSARAHRGATAPRPARSAPGRRTPSPTQPHRASRWHRVSLRHQRRSNGRAAGQFGALASSGIKFDHNAMTHTRIAWLRAPRSTTPTTPETRGPPRASPTAQTRPQPSPSLNYAGPLLLGRAPSSHPTPTESAGRTIPGHGLAAGPRARRLEGPAPRLDRPSGGISS
jgi:hypothetical protein